MRGPEVGSRAVRLARVVLSPRGGSDPVLDAEGFVARRPSPSMSRRSGGESSAEVVVAGSVDRFDGVAVGSVRRTVHRAFHGPVAAFRARPTVIDDGRATVDVPADVVVCRTGTMQYG